MKTTSSLLPTASINILKDLLESKAIKVNPSNALVFLCGANTALSDSARSKFLQYAEEHIKGINFFLAEDVFEEMENPHIDLLTIEKYLANYADCILIILESDGAKVELGAFSAHEKLAKKLLVINNKEFEHEKSFISLGPLKKIANESQFNHIKYTYFESVATIFSDTENELSKIRKIKRTSLRLENYDSLKSEHKNRLLFLADIVWMFAPVSHIVIIDIFKKLFGKTNNYYFIKRDLAFLKAIKLIDKTGITLLRPTKNHLTRRFCSFGDDETLIESLRAQIINFYFKRKPSVFASSIVEVRKK